MFDFNRVQQLREFYNSGATRSYAFRKEQLLRLKTVILKYENAIYEALKKDLNKSPEESWVTEIALVLNEIRYALNQLKKWMRPQKVKTNLINFPSSSRIIPEPLGVVFIISPWNYPFQLLLKPLVGAISAGNCVVLKSSEHAPATTLLLRRIITDAFDDKYILFTEGQGAEVVPAFINHFRFDHIFFTGGPVVGKSIYQLAAKDLVPVTLELGGKSPCVVESDADISTAARRIAIAKFSNSGQICIAPDYLLVHHSVKNKLIKSLQEAIIHFFGNQPEASGDYGRVINEKQFDRIVGYLNDGKIIFGGRHDRSQLFIEPTLIDDVNIDGNIMKEEIFGPLLPIITYRHTDEVLKIISRNPNPLAFYLFTISRQKEKFWMDNVAFGGGCVNNAAWHITNHHLPLGGRGFSGIGQYQGRKSFDTFSHMKSVMKTPNWFDPNFKYPPLKGRLKFLKKII
ncbi:MAG: aldehyde dehydrogenase [Ferruginibacter sp.]|nr:aldehyde dehydrogenase [Ferruginibacter sp.]